MNNKKGSEGMERIWKSTLARVVDPVKRERRKENSHGVSLKRNVSQDDKDDLDPFILQALNNIGSRGRNSVDTQKGCVEQDGFENKIGGFGGVSKNELNPGRSDPVNWDGENEFKERRLDDSDVYGESRKKAAYEDGVFDNNHEKKVADTASKQTYHRSVLRNKDPMRKNDSMKFHKHLDEENRDSQPPRFRNRRSVEEALCKDSKTDDDGKNVYGESHKKAAYKDSVFDHNQEKKIPYTASKQTYHRSVLRNKDPMSMRKNDTRSFHKHLDEENRDSKPPRFRNRRREEALHKDSNTDDDGQNVDEDSLTGVSHDCESEDRLQKNEGNLDTYDRWKMKRQKNFASKSNAEFKKFEKASHQAFRQPSEQHRPVDLKTNHSSSDCQTIKGGTSFDEPDAPGLFQHAANQTDTARKTDCNKTFDKRESPTNATNGSINNWEDEDVNGGHPSHFQESTMFKIQNLFLSYVSPVSNSSKKIDSCPEDQSEASKHYFSKSKSVEKDSTSGRVSFKECKDESGDKFHDDEDSKHCAHARHEKLRQSMDDLHISEKDYDTDKDTKNCNQSSTYQEVHAADHSINSSVSQSKHLQSELVTKSPASIPSGFSSDYDVGDGYGESQSQSDEDQESPHPPVANLFPSHSQPPSNWNPPMSEWQGYSRHHPMYWDGQYPHHYPVPFHHGQYYGHPYIPHQSYAGSESTESSPLTKQTPREPKSHATTLTIPSETFNDKGSMDKLLDFVSNKTNEWNNFMRFHHGRTVPVDIIINVKLSDTRDIQSPKDASIAMPPSSYPSSHGWQFPMYPSNMGYYHHPYWQHPHHESKEGPKHHAPHSSDYPANVYDAGGDQTTGRHMKARESVRHKLHKKVQQSHYPSTDCLGELDEIPEYPSVVSPYPDTVDPDVLSGASNLNSLDPSDNNRGHFDSEDTMKRRSFSLEVSDDSEVAAEVSDRKKKKIKQNDCEHVNSSLGNKSTEYDRERKSKQCNDRNVCSVSSFLNPNDLSNEWITPPKASKYHSKRNSDSSQIPIQEDEIRGRKSFPRPEAHRLSHKKLSGEKPTVEVSDDACLKELNQDLYSGKNTGAKSVSRNWTEESSDTTSAVSSSEHFALSPDSGSSCQEYSNSHHRRRSDSLVSYSSEDRSPVFKDRRLCRTPRLKRDRKYRCNEESDEWKNSLITRSKTYSHQFIDTHCHIDFLYHRIFSRTIPFKQFVEEHSDTFPVNFEGCVAVFCNPKVFDNTSQASAILQLMTKEDKVWVAVGCHPKNATDFRDQHIRNLRKVLQEHPKVVALGEIGLDYSGTFYQHAERQKDVFIQQLNLAKELSLPLVIHCRDADEDCLEIMKKTVPAGHKIHLHCFTRSFNVARRWIDHFPNLCVGFTPVITYVSAREAIQAAEMMPLERMLLETDAPYFVPDGVPIGQVKRVSHPGFALYTAERLAELKGVSVDKILKACRENTRFIYGI